jgi:hypothetical protein
MLRQFGIATVVDLTVSLLGVMVVLPAALVWAEERGPLRLRDLDPRALLAGARPALAELRVQAGQARTRAAGALPGGGLRLTRRRSRA